MGAKGRQTGAQEIAQSVLDYISRETLTEGDRLPSERNLSEQMGICRCSLREGLRLLEAQGYIRVETGRGSFVGAGPQSLALSARNADTLVLLEACVAVQARTASLAAQRRTEAQLDEMQQALDRLLVAQERSDYAQLNQQVAELYHVLAQSAGNEVLVTLVDQLTELTRFVREAVVRSTQTRNSFVSHLQAVVDAVAGGNWQQASQTMRLHLLEGPAALGLVAEGRIDLETKTWLTER